MDTHESRRTYAEGRFSAPQTPVCGIALALVFGFALAGCDNGKESGDPVFMIEDGVLLKYNGPGGAVIIPNGVTEIWCTAFEKGTALTSVTIGSGVTEIQYGAFQGCTALTKVTIPNSVTKIKHDAFTGCTALTTVTFVGSEAAFTTYPSVFDGNYKAMLKNEKAQAGTYTRSGTEESNYIWTKQ